MENNIEKNIENAEDINEISKSNASEKIVISVTARNTSDDFIDDVDEISNDDNSDDVTDEIESDEENDDNNSEDIEEQDQKRKKTFAMKKVGCISCSAVFGLLIAIAVTVTVVFMHYYRLMDIEDNNEMYIKDNVTFSDAEISEIPDGNVDLADGDVFKNKDVFNILLIGTDERSQDFSDNARADSIMILSINNKTKAIKLVSLERGMLVKIPGQRDDILTHTFRYGWQNLLMETVRTHFKVDVDKYIRVNLEMFQKLVDEVGGVDIVLTKREAYGLNKSKNGNTWELDRKVHEGINHFNGYEALQYSRLRWIDSDFQRIERQRKVIIAIKESLTDLSVSDLKDLSADCLPYIQTNLSAMEFAGLLVKLPGFYHKDIEQMTIPKKGTYKSLGHVDFTENTIALKKFLYD